MSSRRPTQAKDTRKLLMFGGRGADALGVDHVVRVEHTWVRQAIQRSREKARTGSIVIVVTGRPTRNQMQRITEAAQQAGYTVLGGPEEGNEAPRRASPRSERIPARERLRADPSTGLRSYPPVTVRRPALHHRIDPEEGEDTPDE